MDCDTKKQCSDHKEVMSMESDDFGSCDNLWDDDEFVSCEEGEEEVFQHILSASEEADFTEQTSGVDEDDLGGGESRFEKKRICSAPASLQTTYQSKFVVTVSKDVVKSKCEIPASLYAHQNKARSKYFPLSQNVSDFGETSSETVKEAGSRLKHVSSEVTPQSSLNSCRMSEGFLYKHRENIDFLASKLEYEKALFHTLDKIAVNCVHGTLSSFDEEDEEDEFHDTRSRLSRIQSLDSEFYDTRSSLSRIQSLDDECMDILVAENRNNFLDDEECSSGFEVDDGINILVDKEHTNVLESIECLKTLEDIECTSNLVDEECSNSLEVEEYTNILVDKEHGNVSECEECTNTSENEEYFGTLKVECNNMLIDNEYFNTLEGEKCTSVLEVKHKFPSESGITEKEPSSKQCVSPFVMPTNPEIDSDQSNIRFEPHPHIWISVNSSEKQREDTKFKGNLRSNPETTIKALENCSEQGLEFNTEQSCGVKQGRHCTHQSTLLSSNFNSLSARNSNRCLDSLILHAECSEIIPPGNARTEVSEPCPSVNIPTQVTELCPSLNILTEASESCPSVNIPTEVSEPYPSVNIPTEVSEPCPSINIPTEVSEPYPSVNIPTEVSEPCPSINIPTEVSEPCPSVNIPTEVSEPCPSVIIPTEVSEPCPSVNIPTEVSEPCPSVNIPTEAFEPCPLVNIPTEASNISLLINSTTDVSELCLSVNTAKQVSKLLPAEYTTGFQLNVQPIETDSEETQHISQILPPKSASKQLSESLPPESAAKQLSEMLEIIPPESTTKQLSELIEIIPPESTTKQLSELIEIIPPESATKQLSELIEIIPPESTTKQLSELIEIIPPESATKQLSELIEIIPPESTTKQLSELIEIIPPESATKQLSELIEIIPPESTTKQLSELIEIIPPESTAKQLSELIEIIPPESTAKQLSELIEIIPPESAAKQLSELIEIIPPESATKQLSELIEIIPPESATKQLSELIEIIPPESATKQLSELIEIIPPESTTKQLSKLIEIIPPESAAEQLSELIEIIPPESTTKQLSELIEIIPPESTTKQLSELIEIIPPESAAEQLSEMLPSAKATKQIPEASPSLCAAKQISAVLTCENATKQVSGASHLVSTPKQESEVLQSESAAKQVSQVSPSLSALKQVSETYPTESTTNHVSETLALESTNNHVFEVSEVPLPINLVNKVSEVPLPINLVNKVSEVPLPINLVNKVSEVPLPINLVNKVSEVPLPINLVNKVSEVPLPINLVNKVSEVPLPINLVNKVSEVPLPINLVNKVSEVPLPINLVNKVSEVPLPINLVNKVSEVPLPINLVNKVSEVPLPINLVNKVSEINVAEKILEIPPSESTPKEVSVPLPPGSTTKHVSEVPLSVNSVNKVSELSAAKIVLEVPPSESTTKHSSETLPSFSVTNQFSETNHSRIHSSQSSKLFNDTLEDISHLSSITQSVETSWTDRPQISFLEVMTQNIPQVQHSCISSQDINASKNLGNQIFNNNNNCGSKISSFIDKFSNKTCGNHNKIDSYEENVCEGGLGAGIGSDTNVDICCDELAEVGSPESDLSDSLDESEEIPVSCQINVLPRLEVKPKLIDTQQAKLRSSLSWLLSKVYGSNIPKEFQDPFYESAEGQLVLRPIIVNMMSSSELYCQACSNMFPETYTQWQGHWSIIQVLSRKGIYISEVQESAVTETVLVQTAPFRLKAHLALIDALMKAYICEVASVEKVVKAVRQITTFPASSELPVTPEEALVFWINKVCSVLRTEGGSRRKSEEIMEGIAGQKVRVFSKTSAHNEPVQVPLLEDLMRDVGDGCSIGAVIAFYRPHLLNIKGLCFKEGIGIADSLHNLCQIGVFCRSHLPCKNFYLSNEDLLYTHDVMRVNIIAFLADLFICFEGPNSLEGDDRVLSSGKSSSEKVEGMIAAGKKSSQNVPLGVQISQATKRSFHRQGFEETASNLGMGRSGSYSPISHQPLLSKRIAGRHCIPQEEGGTSVTSSSKRRTGRRAVSLFTPEDRETVHKSVLAWQDDQEMLHRAESNDGSDSDKPVSTDLMLNQNFNANNSLSLDLRGLETPFQTDHIELESVTSDQSRLTSPQYQTDRRGNRTPTALNADHRLEPLMPALLRPIKEKETNLSKAEERGDRSPRRKKMTSPPEHQLQIVPQVQRSTAQSPQQRRQRHVDTDSNYSEQSDETTVSPLTSDTSSERSQSPFYKSQPLVARGRAFEAFVVGPDSETEVALEGKQNQDRATDISTACSYTVKDSPCSAQAARAAGIPVVADSEEITSTTDRSREGSIASSGEYSDHESQKIHQEYKMRESNLTITSTLETKEADININNNSKSLLLITDHLSNNTSKCGDDETSIFNKLTTTNFAELKRLKDKLGYNLDKVDGNALIYMQSGSHGGPFDKMSGLDLKPMFVIKQSQGQQQNKNEADKTVSTNQQPEMPSSTLIADNATLEAKDSNPGSLEMQQLRLKLEQKRKDIERKKHRQEAQQNKMRQQLGKAAFMRVVSKHIEGEAEGDDQTDAARSEHTPNSSQAQLQARLGHPVQKLPLDLSDKSQLPAHSLPLQNQGGQNSVIPADASAQRFTDWRAQSQLSRAGGANISGLTANESVAKNLDPAQQQFLLRSAGAVGGNGVGSDYSPLSPGNKAFSREGIQQTIDTVRNKWFKNGNDFLPHERRAEEEEEDADGRSFRLHDSDLLAGARARTVQDHSRSPARSHSQSPLHDVSQNIPSRPDTSVSMFPRETASPSQSISDMEYQEYDSSLDKLNTSLTELQGEIMRLSLQHEQLKAAQSPVSNQSAVFPQRSNSLPTVGVPLMTVSSTQSRPLHGIPQKVQFGQKTEQGGPFSSSQKQLVSNSSLSHQNDLTTTGNSDRYAPLDSLQPALSDFPTQTKSADEIGSTPYQFKMDSYEPNDIVNITNDGFFVSFGDKTTPKRLKPKFPEHRTRGVSPAPTVAQTTTPSPAIVTNNTAKISNEVAANLAGQTIVPTLNSQKNDEISDESSPNIGFTIKDEAVIVKESAVEDDMHKKRVKLMEMQRKRKEEQERKKSEKEAEIAKKLEEKQLKEEELEKKKAEEKARREQIFQQYLQKKQEEEESPVKAHNRKRDASANKQRPKSMFVKKAMTPEPGTLAPDSGSSSQEDLNLGGRSTPSVMSAMRSSFNFRLPQPSNIRKAVSCNTLQGATNGVQGPSTYRRPTSPDLNRMKQQRQRSNNQDSGSESSSNPGVEYAGPKLFVKPSARSNRHIIVNAISHCCLAGSVNTDMKNKVLEDLAKCDANHFLILFRDAGCQYRGLFVFSPETEEAFKIHGVGPKHIVNEMCEKFYKYNSGAKSFSEITSTKHLSVSVDAVVLYTAVWKSVKAVIKR